MSLLDTPSQPELEDPALLDWGLAQSELYSGSRASIDVLHGHGSNLGRSYSSMSESMMVDLGLEWVYEIADVTLDDIVSVCLMTGVGISKC